MDGICRKNGCERGSGSQTAFTKQNTRNAKKTPKENTPELEFGGGGTSSLKLQLFFDTFADKTVLVIGAGKMADLTLRHLAALKPGRIVVTNRTPDRAEAAAKRWGGEVVPFDIIPFFRMQRSIIGSFCYTRAEVETCLELARRGKIVPLVHKTFPLSEVREAMLMMERREHFGKIVLRP